MSRSFTDGELSVMIYDTRGEMGSQAGRDAASCIRRCIEDRGEANVMFAAAPSQNEMLDTLCGEDIDWSKVNAFHMDEYIGIPDTHHASFRWFLDNAIWKHFSFKSVNRIKGDAADIAGEIERYSTLLKEHPLDVCLCGVGENGHLAFNDPDVADFHDPVLVKKVKLDDVCRQQQVNDGCFPDISAVPYEALTVTIPGLMNARHVICTVPGPTKANAVKKMLEGEICTDCPASILREHEDAHLYLDSNSAGRLVIC